MLDAGLQPRSGAIGSQRPSGTGQAISAFDFADIEPVPGFEALADPRAYTGLPADWVVGLSDVVNSTAAIEAGRYKAVNTAGAAVISAVANALGRVDFPFSFGGDGASFAVPPGDAESARAALAATVAWVSAELDLELRGAMLTVEEIRAAGHDLTVARFAASPDLAYAMFSGGGHAWAEQQLKTGAVRLAPAPPDARPDLTGLTCRFEDIEAANGVILSLIVRPEPGREGHEMHAIFAEVLGLARTQPRDGHPVPAAGPRFGRKIDGFSIESHLNRPSGRSLAANRIVVAARAVLLRLMFWSGVKVGGVIPSRYLTQLVANSDVRKFDDGLMMTLDCAPEIADRIEACLTQAQSAGLVQFGLFRQRSALITCMVPSAQRPDHIHFVDGASGGYALAARDLKTRNG